MHFIALLPFVVLFLSFSVLRISLLHSSFIALLVSTVLSGTIFQVSRMGGDVQVWNTSLIQTLEFMVEIGLILFGVFLFLEVAAKTEIIASLARLVQNVSPSRAVQGILVTFPLELMFEGSSGFGTPLLLTAPILITLGFPPLLCAILPFLSMINGVPFGALGTPLRLGFPGAELTHATALLLMPFAWITPLLTYFLILKLDPASEKANAKTVLWIVFLGAVYSTVNFFVSKTGPEFPTLASGFTTFIVGWISATFCFRSTKKVSFQSFFLQRRGIFTYALLLLSLWIGKQVWMDQTFPGVHIRVFNPGWVFILFAIFLTHFFKKDTLQESFLMAWERAKRSIFVLFCMTFTVQQLRHNGGLLELTQNIPSLLQGSGVAILGWLGSIFIGTSTVTNLLFSKGLPPESYPLLAASSAIGVQLAFQAITAMRSTLNDSISEKRLFQLLAPISFSFVVVLMLIANFYGKTN